MMRTTARCGMAVAAVVALMSAGLALTGPAQAMGSGDAYEDLQVGVTYTVYEPSYTGGMKLTHTGTQWTCEDGAEQNMLGGYGHRWKGGFNVNEGKPICSDPGGDGWDAGTVMVQGVKAHMEVYCDPADSAQWTSCSRSDMAKYGGALEFTLPGVGSLRSTDIIIETLGARPLSARQMVKVARSLRAVASQPVIGGMTSCTQAALSDALSATMGKREVLVSIDSFACADGWAYVFATVGDGRGHDIGVTQVFEAEGQFWILKDRQKVCGTVDVNHPSVRPADSQVPAAIWANGCDTD